MFVEVLLLSLLLFLYCYMTWTHQYDYWKEIRVPYVRGSFPFGNIKDIILMRKTIGEVYNDLYWKFPEKPLFGFFKLWQPVLMVRDPELVKIVLVKEFENFHDNDYYVNPKIDPILGLNPFNSKGKDWKAARNVVTPSLTLSKIKAMVPQIIDVSKELNIYLKKNHGQSIEAYDLAGKFTSDVVCSCAFGVESNSFKDDSSEVRSMSRKMFDGSFRSNFALLAAFFFPKLNEFLKWKILSQEVEDFFVDLAGKISDYRTKNEITRNDYIQSLIDMNNEAKKKNTNEKPFYSNIEMAAHCMSFFLDGYETTEILLGFILFELGINENIQEKLRKELITSGKSLTQFDFDSINKLQFMEMVVQEGLRKHPPGTTTTRVCTKSTYLPFGKTKLRIEKGTPVVLPMYSIHNDPKFFHDPEVFDPERFSEKSKGERHQYAHFPFGAGPRSCPGFKFALSMVKLAIASILQDFKIKLSEGQPKEIEMDPMNTFFHSAKGGLWLTFVELEKEQH